MLAQSRIKRPVAVALLSTLLFHVAACTSTHTVPLALRDAGPTDRIIGVMLKDGRRVDFDPELAAVVSRDSVVAFLEGRPKNLQVRYAVAIADVDRVLISRTHTEAGATTWAVIAVVAVVALVALGISGTKNEPAPTPTPSCPFVYSWDGNRYILDAEPFGGAVTRGLERDDYSLLEHLTPEHGSYRLRMTNEMDEQQYTDLLELWVVDHPADVRVIPDEFGRLHTVGTPLPARSALADGRDIGPVVAASDWRLYEPAPDLDPAAPVRSVVELTFPKPEGAAAVKLVANASTGQIGAEALRRLLELHGDELDAWYATIDGNTYARDSLRLWSLREELYVLKVEVREPDGWHVRGFLPGGGPYATEERVVSLDISRARGTELEVRLRPPRGFWAFNSFAVDYSVDRPVTSRVVQPSAGPDRHGIDQAPALRAADGSYYVMPQTGDRSDLVFPAPPAATEGLHRSVFAHTRGYYRVNASPTGPARTEVLQRMADSTDAAAAFIGAEFRARFTARRN